MNHSGPGTTSNAILGSGLRCGIYPKSGHPYVSVFATKTIMPGEEILMHYDKGWRWPWQQKQQPQMMARMPRSEHIPSWENTNGRGRGRGRGRGDREEKKKKQMLNVS